MGILATNGTKETKIYDKYLIEQDISFVYPNQNNQDLVMKLIYDYIKKGNFDISNLNIDEIFDDLESKGAQAVILGCTELPIALKDYTFNSIQIVDPTEIVAKVAITSAGGKIT